MFPIMFPVGNFGKNRGLLEICGNKFKNVSNQNSQISQGLFSWSLHD
jgi:hypothetical protein